MLEAVEGARRLQSRWWREGVVGLGIFVVQVRALVPCERPFALVVPLAGEMLEVALPHDFQSSLASHARALWLRHQLTALLLCSHAFHARASSVTLGPGGLLR